MKVLTPIVQFYLNLNFIDNKEVTNLVVDSYDSLGFSIIPSDPLLHYIRALNGKIIYTKCKFELLLPLTFDGTTTDTEFLNLVPENLIFYVISKDASVFSYSGLPQKIDKKSILVLTPHGLSQDYIYGSKKISAIPCCSENAVISENDVIKIIPFDGTLDDYRNIIEEENYDFNTEEFEFKINGTSQKLILDSVGILRLQKELLKYLHQSINLKITDSAKKIVAKKYSKVHVVSQSLDKSIIAIIIVAKSNLILTNTERKLFENVNRFMLEFPNLKTDLTFHLSTQKYDVSDKIFIDDKAVTLTVNKHEELEDCKKVSFTVKNHNVFKNKSHFIKWVKKKQVVFLPYNPVSNYNKDLNVSTISITKKGINN